MKRKHVLGKKILFFYVLLAIIICITLCLIGYLNFKDTTYKTYNDFGYYIARIASSYIDGDKIPEYIETKKVDESYNIMEQEINRIYENSLISGIEIVIPNLKDKSLSIIYDIHIDKNGNDESLKLGDVSNMDSENLELFLDIYKTGKFTKKFFLRNAENRYNISAVLPIKDSNGKSTALLIVDVPMYEVQSAMWKYLIISILTTIILVMIFIGLLQFVLHKVVISPLKLISEEASNFTKNNAEISTKLMNIKTQDEIEVMATNIYQMEVDINKYIEDITVITKEKERIGAELSVATEIQTSMLPSVFPAFPQYKEFDIFASMTPAKEVGGDFYDFFLIDDNHVALVIADVSGKGIPAALFMVVSKTLIKNCMMAKLTPSKVLEEVNNQLCEDNNAQMFVTAWIAVYEISTARLTASNAGHEYPYIKRNNGDFELYKDKHGFVLGGMENLKFSEYTIQLNRGDKLFVYTDGVVEAMNSSNKLYGKNRTIQVLNKNKDNRSKEILTRVKADIDLFAGEVPQFDDITMLGLEIL